MSLKTFSFVEGPIEIVRHSARTQYRLSHLTHETFRMHGEFHRFLSISFRSWISFVPVTSLSSGHGSIYGVLLNYTKIFFHMILNLESLGRLTAQSQQPSSVERVCMKWSYP